jgi:hypothetical protein
MAKELEFNITDIVNKHRTGNINSTYIIIDCSSQIIRDGIRSSLKKLGLKDNQEGANLVPYVFEKYKYVFISDNGKVFFLHNELLNYKTFKSEEIFWLV